MKQVSQQIPFDDILVDDQARRVGATIDSIDALKNSIATIGLLDPLILEALPGGKFRLCAGRNRYTAIKALRNEGKTQFEELPSTVLEFDDHELLDENYKNYKISQVIFDSNDKRSQLTKFEQARHYSAQKQQFPHLFKDDGELAKFNNKPVNEVVEALRLLAIDPAVVEKVEELNLESPNTIPFMCLEEIAEAAALPKRPLPPAGQMEVIELLTSPDLPDKRALVARDKMRNLVNSVRKEYAPDPRGRKPKQDTPERGTEYTIVKTPEDISLFTENASPPTPEAEKPVDDSDAPKTGGSSSFHKDTVLPATEAKNGPASHGSYLAGNEENSRQESGQTSQSVRPSDSPTLAIVNISITNSINALRRDMPTVTHEQYQSVIARLEELRQLLQGAVSSAI